MAAHLRQIVLGLLNGNKSGGMDVPDYREDPASLTLNIRDNETNCANISDSLT